MNGRVGGGVNRWLMTATSTHQLIPAEHRRRISRSCIDGGWRLKIISQLVYINKIHRIQHRHNLPVQSAFNLAARFKVLTSVQVERKGTSKILPQLLVPFILFKITVLANISKQKGSRKFWIHEIDGGNPNRLCNWLERHTHLPQHLIFSRWCQTCMFTTLHHDGRTIDALDTVIHAIPAADCSAKYLLCMLLEVQNIYNYCWLKCKIFIPATGWSAKCLFPQRIEVQGFIADAA